MPESETLTFHERHFDLRAGAMGFILMHFILWFHETIEHLDVNKVWDEWGHAVRPVRGQTVGYSNHAGGGAADLNSVMHPRGAAPSKSFSVRQMRNIRLWLQTAKYAGTLAWGGDWRLPDGMHVEITSVSMKRIKKVARALAKTPRGKRILAANPGVNPKFP